MNVDFISMPVDQLRVLLKETVKEVLRERKAEPYSEYPELLTRKQTCDILGISLATCDKYARNGLIIKHRINTSIRFKKAEVLQALKSLQK